MIDPPRPEASEAIERCKQAGIKVTMVTGDHLTTGKAIARQIGILNDSDRVLGGSQIDEMDDDQLDAVMQETAVFARVSPAHKQRIVASLQRHGHVVAMTGDGVNDAPALKAAQVGVAMGITGTDVTKETAEMVLTDDNFASIVNAVEEGRVVFGNVRSRTRSLFQLGVFSNRYLVIAILVPVLLLVLVTLIPFFQIALNTVPLAPADWALVVLVSSTVFFAEEIRKALQKHATRLRHQS